MTDAQNPATPQTPTVAAGWYPDPSNAGQQRWWDGTRWTEQVSAPVVAAPVPPYAGGAQPTAPQGTSGNTVWIWLVVFLPLVGLLPVFFIDFAGLIRGSVENASDPAGMTQTMLAFYGHPAFIASIVLSLLVTVLTIVFAYLDWRTLTRRGVPQPFHWAYSLLALAGFGIVYPIGRAIVAKRRTGSGNGVLLATILTIVASFIFAIVLTVLLVNYSLALVASS